jgi:hypothetical protein
MLTKIHSSLAIYLFISSFSFAQSSYLPPKPEGVSDEDYRAGKYMLENSRAQIKGKMDAGHYWNFAQSYARMGQPKDSILHFLELSRADDEKWFCQLIHHYDDKAILEKSFLFKRLGQSLPDLISSCGSVVTTPTKFDFVQYTKENNLDLQLIVELDRIQALDIKHRVPYDTTLQGPLDRQNQIDVEHLITKWGYPGRKLVGDHYESTCWAVVQHASLNYQEKYLPLIHKAVMENQLNDVPLKMLLDRIYMKKTKSQIFGSQMGVKFADDKTIAEVKIKYGLH